MTEPRVYSPYLRTLKCLTIWRYKTTKVAHSPWLFQDPDRWSGLGLEPSTSRTAQQTGALPTERISVET